MPIGAITGFGVNGQPRNWGSSGAAVKPALDLLVRDLGANFFRVEIAKGQSSWEQTNDDADPNHFDWTKYDPIFQGKDFTDLFDYIRYLNQLGVTEIQLSAHGPVASWMGGNAIPSDKEDELVETMLAVMVYARTRAPSPRPSFSLFSPWNETDIGPPEGVKLDENQGTRILRKLVTRMNALPELNGIMVVSPDSANEWSSYAWRNLLVQDSAIRARLRAVSFHRYGGYSTTSVDWNNANPPQWLTEFNDWVSLCYTASWTNALNLAENLLGALQGGVTAGLVWTDYDAPHSHDNDKWETFGLLATALPGQSNLCNTLFRVPTQTELDGATYTPKVTYQAIKHAFRHIARGAVKVSVSSASGGPKLIAFKNPNGQTVVFGTNRGSAGTFQIHVGTTPAPTSLTPWISTNGSYHQQGAAVALSNGTGNFALPASSVFTLIGQ